MMSSIVNDLPLCLDYTCNDPAYPFPYNIIIQDSWAQKRNEGSPGPSISGFEVIQIIPKFMLKVDDCG